MNDPLDELLGIDTPKDVSTSKVSKNMKDLSRAISSGEKNLRHSDCEDVTEVIGGIANELSWVEDDVHKLIDAYDEAMSALSYYRSVVEQRLDDDERFDLNAIRVKQRFIQANEK